jgi:hypothetical protein
MFAIRATRTYASILRTGVRSAKGEASEHPDECPRGFDRNSGRQQTGCVSG